MFQIDLMQLIRMHEWMNVWCAGLLVCLICLIMFVCVCVCVCGCVCSSAFLSIFDLCKLYIRVLLFSNFNSCDYFQLILYARRLLHRAPMVFHIVFDELLEFCSPFKSNKLETIIRLFEFGMLYHLSHPIRNELDVVVVAVVFFVVVVSPCVFACLLVNELVFE